MPKDFFASEMIKDAQSKAAVIDNQHAGDELVMLGVRISKELRRQLKHRAANTGEPINKFIERIAWETLKIEQ